MVSLHYQLECLWSRVLAINTEGGDMIEKEQFEVIAFKHLPKRKMLYKSNNMMKITRSTYDVHLPTLEYETSSF